MSADPLSSTLFAAPMPWLHASSIAETFDTEAAASVLAHHFRVSVALPKLHCNLTSSVQIPPKDLQPFMSAVTASNTWLTRPPNSRDVNDALHRRSVAQWAWKIELNSPLNNTSRGYIPCLMLPLIIVDVLLHVSNPDPAPIAERAPHRMKHEISQVCVQLWVVVSYLSCRAAFSSQIRLGGSAATIPFLLQPAYRQVVEPHHRPWNR